MRPFDPAAPARGPCRAQACAALAAVGVLQGIATVATAFALTALVVAVVVGLPVGRPAAWLLAVFTVRAALAWLAERTAAWAGLRVSSRCASGCWARAGSRGQRTVAPTRRGP